MKVLFLGGHFCIFSGFSKLNLHIVSSRLLAARIVTRIVTGIVARIPIGTPSKYVPKSRETERLSQIASEQYQIIKPVQTILIRPS